MTYTKIQLETIAQAVRRSIIEMLVAARSGHSAGSLGMTDVFVALYFSILNIRPTEPLWEDRDRLVLSNGHICPAQYATLAHRGYFSIEELRTLRKLGSRLQGHPKREALPGIETTSGPLGSGLSQAAGMALGARLDRKKWHTFCLLSDGELEEGNTWEAFMFAGKNRLHELTAIVDRNNIQIDGHTEDIMPLEPLVEKFESFNWAVLEINGHDFSAIQEACAAAKRNTNKPTVIIAHTIPGKGVEFMENKYEWHGKPPTQEEGERALANLKDIRTLGGRINAGHGG